MATDDRLPSGLKRLFVEAARQLADELGRVDPAVRLGEAVKEHSLLRRRERVDVFDLTAARKLSQMPLVQFE